MGPVFAALMTATLVNLVSENVNGSSRLAFQAVAFSILALVRTSAKTNDQGRKLTTDQHIVAPVTIILGLA